MQQNLINIRHQKMLTNIFRWSSFNRRINLWRLHLQKNLKKGNNYDALNEEWSNKIIWAIIPFSHLRPFLLMLPTNQMIQKDIYEKYLEKIVEKKEYRGSCFNSQWSSDVKSVCTRNFFRLFHAIIFFVRQKWYDAMSIVIIFKHSRVFNFHLIL